MLKNLKNKKRAIVLFNLGGPSDEKSIRPFLFNLFNDKYIIALPKILRWLFATIISYKRESTAKKIYSSLGGRSPILEETKAQALSLSKSLEGYLVKGSYKVFICMRHWHPMSQQVIEEILAYQPEEIISLPLYPQFSTTTSLSSIENFFTKMQSKMPGALYKTVCCYPRNSSLAKGYANLIKRSLQKVHDKNNFRILFSAHGLPKRIIESGDPYQWQIKATTSAIIDNLHCSEVDYIICYQSKVGPLKWLTPTIENEIARAAKDQKEIIIVPISFVSEHSETLVELDIEYKILAEQLLVNYVRVPTLSVDSYFIHSLRDIVVNFSRFDVSILSSDEIKRICPLQCTRCPCSNYK